MTNLLIRRLCFASKLPRNSCLSTSIPQTLVQKRQFLQQDIAMMSFTKSISTSSIRLKDTEEHDEEDSNEQAKKEDWMSRYTGDPKDRTREIPLEKSMLYLESDAYLQTYGKKRVMFMSNLLSVARVASLDTASPVAVLAFL